MKNSWVTYVTFFLCAAVFFPGCSLVPHSELSTIESQENYPTRNIHSTSSMTATKNIAQDNLTLTSQGQIPNNTKVSDMRKEMLQNLDICDAPCLWTIKPNSTTIDEAKSIFLELNSPLELQAEGSDGNYYSSDFQTSDELNILVYLIERSQVIEFIKTDLAMANYQDNPSIREWQAFSPETIISTYGLPSYVEFYLPMGPNDGISPYMSYAMVLYFDPINLIIKYSSSIYIKDEDPISVCPSADDMDGVSIWLGRPVKDTPQKKGVPLEEATSLSMENFINVMLMENKVNACMELQRSKFYPNQ